MTFEEIFEKDGRYTSDDFVEGFCLEICEGTLIGNQYSDKDDIFPERWNFTTYKSLFKHNYKPVLTRQSLFKNKTL